MWLMTKHGFYSIVEKQKGEFHVRSRERKDIENLINGIPLKGSTIIDTPDADYAYRIIVTKEDVQAIMSFLGETLDYSNFKGKIDRTPDQKHKPYHKVWQVMADALGAYGNKGIAIGVITVSLLTFLSTHIFAQAPDMKSRIKNEAQILSTAMETGDYEKAASRLPAELLEKSGGIAGLKQAMERAKGKSPTGTPHQTIGEVSSVAKAGQFTYAIVNTSMKIATGSDTAIVKSYMVGISKDGGDNWVFLNGSDSAKERLIRKHTELATTLIFPIRTMTTGGSTYIEVNGQWVPDEKTYQEMKATAERISQ